MSEPMAPAVPVLNADRTLSEFDVVALPTDVHSSSEPGFVCHWMIPPNELNVKFRRGTVTAGDRFGAVAAATNAVGTVDTPVAATFAGPSVFGSARAVGVIANVDDLA